MVQKRIKDFATPADAEDLKDLINAITTPSVLQGFDFQVDGPNRMRVEPGTAVTHQGVLIIENENQFKTIENTTNSVDYTIYYSHEDESISGGVTAELVVAQGLFANNDIKGVVLGYVRYPGNGVPLNPSHFIEPVNLQLSNFIPNRENVNWTIPIKGNGFLVRNQTGPSLTISDVFDTSPASMYLRVRNDNATPGNGQLDLIFPFKVNDIPFALVQFNMQIDNSVAANVSLIDTVGGELNLHVGQLQAQPNLFLHNLSIPREAVLNPNKLCYVRVSLDIPATRKVKLQGIGLSSFNLPV